jgi:dTDP-glucose pyrophosphorylase
MITQVLENIALPTSVSLLYVIQPTAAGPVSAFWLGLQSALRGSVQDSVMMLCGDNYIPQETWDNAIKIFYENAHQDAMFFGCKHCATSEATRMTVFEEDGLFANGLSVQPQREKRLHRCWVGPVMFTGCVRAEIEACAPHCTTFAELFNRALQQAKERKVKTSRYSFVSTTQDIGVPEALS